MRRAFRTCLLVAALALGLPASGWMQEPPAKEISDKASAELGRLRLLIDAKNNAEAIRQLDRVIPSLAPESYDLAFLSQLKVQLLLSEGRFDAAFAPLTVACRLGERYGYFDERTTLDQLYLLSQLTYQQASEAKDKTARLARFTEAYDYLQRWFRLAPVPTSEVQLFAASILYQQATSDSVTPDPVRLRQAQAEAEKGLYLDLKANDQFYILILAILQQQGDLARSAEILEVLVKRQPAGANYWQQLASTYMSLAGGAKTEAETFRFNLRAVLTIERAQSRGLLASPRDNLNLVGLYFNLRQHDRAAALLEKGLADGSIENNRRNWETLASAYQQLNQDARAVTTLERATQVFPEDGQLQFLLAQHLYGLGRVADTAASLEKAIAKGHLEKPGQTYLFLAYAAYELQRYDDAARWADEAEKYNDTKVDDLRRFKHAVREAREPRESRDDHDRGHRPDRRERPPGPGRDRL